MINHSLEIVSWNDIKEKVKKVNSTIASIVDGFNFKNDIKFCKIDYPFGATIFKNGVLLIFNKKINRSISSEDFPVSYIKKHFFCYPLPFGMILKNSMSIFFEKRKDPTSSAVFYPGQVFGLMESFNSIHSVINKKNWNLCAGVRMLFPADDHFLVNNYNILKKKFDLHSAKPQNKMDQFFLLRELVNHPLFSCNWSTTILLFDKSITKALKEKNIWSLLQPFFLKHAWEQAIGQRFSVISSTSWNQLNNILKIGKFKNPEYQVSIIRNIIEIALGYKPLLVSSDYEEITAPINLIKEILINECNAKYYPTIITSGYISKEGYNGGYCSIKELFLTQLSHRSLLKCKNTLQAIAYDVYCGYQFLQKNIANYKSLINNHLFQRSLKQIKLKIFNVSPNKNRFFLPSIAMLKYDKNLITIPNKYNKRKLSFNDRNPFFDGLIKIEKKLSKKDKN